MELEDIVEILKNDPAKVIPDLLDDVREQYGEVPYIMNFLKDMPEIFIPKTLYDNSIMREFKHLDQETVELISIGVASTLRCEHCLKMHLRIAKRKGFPKEKIFSAIMIGAVLSHASVLAESKKSLKAEYPDEGDENTEEKELVCTPDCEVCRNVGKNLDQEAIELIFYRCSFRPPLSTLPENASENREKKRDIKRKNIFCNNDRCVSVERRSTCRKYTCSCIRVSW